MDFNIDKEIKKKVLEELGVGTFIFLFGVVVTFLVYNQTGIFNSFMFYGITFFSLLSFFNISLLLWRNRKHKKTA